jgi:hypothetical protein
MESKLRRIISTNIVFEVKSSDRFSSRKHAKYGPFFLNGAICSIGDILKPAEGHI